MSLQIEQMPMVRVFFSKTGRARFTSHLDTMRMFQRAFKRSGLPVWYTQGFNPHIYMTFSLPIALGYESVCESVDIRLTKETPFEKIADKLGKALPPGFGVVKAATPVQDPREIACADYDVRLIYSENTAAIRGKLGAFLDLPVIEVLKKSKKGEKLVDIKPMSEILNVEADGDTLELKLRMASGNTLNINPTLLLKAFYTWSNTEPDGVRIVRTAILDQNKGDFA